MNRLSAIFLRITHQVAAQVFDESLSDKCNCSHPDVAISIIATLWLLTWGVQKCKVGGKVQVPVKMLPTSTHGCAVPSGCMCLPPWTGLKKRNWIWEFLLGGGSVCVTNWCPGMVGIASAATSAPEGHLHAIGRALHIKTASLVPIIIIFGYIFIMVRYPAPILAFRLCIFIACYTTYV